MLFLVELDHVKPTVSITLEAGRAFIEQIILPTLARAEQLMAEKKILRAIVIGCVEGAKFAHLAKVRWGGRKGRPS
jgi:hypothetical protein